MTTTDPRDVIADSPMSRLQIVVVAITIALNALDGFDVLSISFASPGIAQEWGIDRAALGIVLSMELIGMAHRLDRSSAASPTRSAAGRRFSAVWSSWRPAWCMATTVDGLVDLSVWRIVTGLGIGGMLAAINAVAAEFSNSRRRASERVADVDRLSARRRASAASSRRDCCRATTGARCSTSARASRRC